MVFEVKENGRCRAAPETLLRALIDPSVRADGEVMNEDWQGCLSVPDLWGQVPRRYERVGVEACGRSGEELRFTAEGFHARVIQHEGDHLERKMFIERMMSMASLCLAREFARYWKDASDDQG